MVAAKIRDICNDRKIRRNTLEDNRNNGYEKVCCMCRRTENQAGKMITLPGGLNVCRDCMQRSFDMMMGSGMDWTKMSGFTPEMLKNMYLDPEKAKDVIGHNGDGEKDCCKYS